MKSSLSNQQIIDLLKTLPDNNILYSFVKKLESLIDNPDNNDTVINVINKTYNIILLLIKYDNQTIRLNDKDDKRLKSFQNKYITYFESLKKTKNSNNLIYDLIDLETILFKGDKKKRLNTNDRLLILSNVYNFTRNFDSVFNDQLYSDQIASNYEDEVTYCYCNRPYNGEDMIACDGSACDIEWFHLSCINLKEIPKNTWYCKECTAKGKKILPAKLTKPNKNPKKFVETRGRKKGSKNKPKGKTLV